MKLGLIDYSNSWPFLRHFKKLDWPSLEICADIPSGLNSRLAKGELDVSAVSAFECLKNPDSYYILPDWSINSKRHVRSVMLFSNRPLEDLEGARIGLTGHSATSIHLLKLILKNKGITASYLGDKESHLDARLLIGDPALTFNDPNFSHATDLAQEWTQSTGTPMVFAVMAVRRDRQSLLTQDLKRLSQELIAARKAFSKGLGPLKAEMESSFPNIPLDFDEYFACLDFSFDDPCQRGLIGYATALAEHGFIKNFSSLPLSN